MTHDISFRSSLWSRINKNCRNIYWNIIKLRCELLQTLTYLSIYSYFKFIVINIILRSLNHASVVSIFRISLNKTRRFYRRKKEDCNRVTKHWKEQNKWCVKRNRWKIWNSRTRSTISLNSRHGNVGWNRHGWSPQRRRWPASRVSRGNGWKRVSRHSKSSGGGKREETHGDSQTRR